MNTIIAGRFDAQAPAERAVTALEATGFPRERIATFFVNPAGQQDVHGTRQDPEASAGAHQAGAGAAAGVVSGASVGAVLGLATIPVLGPIGPLAGSAIGGYVGSLVGALDQLGEPERVGEKTPRSDANDDEVPARKSGMLVAVGAATSLEQVSAITVLRAQGATDMETAHGNIAQSRWNDFDPLSTPSWVTSER
jgi:phage tail tape-measure protein